MNAQKWLAAAILLGVISLFTTAHTPADAPSTQQTKTGDFQITFTERSPLSAPKEIAKRLGEKKPGDDYKLDEAPFGVFVPPDYDASTPHGILLYVGYKDAPACPEKWKPLLQKTHTIYISYSQHNDNPAVQIGRVLDGLENMKKLYNIDPQRIYSMGWHKEGTMLGVLWGDVFIKPISIEPDHWRDAPLANNMHVNGDVPRPSGPPLAMAKTHRHAFIARPDQKDLYVGIQRNFSQDGFKTTMIDAGDEDVHFPNVSADWLEKAMEYLDAAPVTVTPAKTGSLFEASDTTPTPSTQPAAKPATPTMSDAQRLLNAAKSYIAAGRADLARTKLQAIIQQFPNDPAAVEAKTLLDQVKSGQ